MKKIIVTLSAAILASALWAAPRPKAEFDQEAQDYREYWLESVKKHEGEKYGALLFIDDLRRFCEQRPQCLLSRVDFAAESLKMQMTKEGVEALKAASKILPSVPDTEEGKFAKAKYYRLSTEASALGKAIAPYRDQVNIATKLAMGYVHEYADYMRQLDASLERLQTDHVDVY
ncbi:MAG: aldo/keto reductase, partial [Treponema sp.]|nr:aldo/keto reductase [Treponema sp.]